MDAATRKANRILFLSTKATRPSHRYRVEQMIPHLEAAGHQCSVAFFPKNPIGRFWFYRRLPQFDMVFIQQRTLDPLELRLVRRLSLRLVFDFDDAVMLNGRHQPDRRHTRRFAAMIRSADLVICGNQFLRERAERCLVDREKKTVEVLPTAIDTLRFRPGLTTKKQADVVTIGWTGSRSTNRYLNDLFPVLARVAGRIELKVISDTTDGFDFSQLGSVPYRFVKWSAQSEVCETAEFDIGLMPLPDDDFTRGKCGCKALQYMALGIPAVCSPVGVNCDIIQHGIDGYLPDGDEAWIETLNRLVRDGTRRHSVGRAGRATAESGYALVTIAGRLADLLKRHSSLSANLRSADISESRRAG